ncbi:MAG: 2-hydroxy-3-oxopropionate reductase [Gammaproteobacteria bacterium]|nr:MAG: 2-hydroxy-3-oxopropionate reductase [Woeseia sp.]GIT37136.1 MAG: 2-hydroxy-3-oxopropionate reductase [Gammaproteobacteria bacterium]|tara:strand:+ start:653 stop:1549 length:897 start_codon:yes stop_codon:yes gene_type:complete
MEKTDTKKIGLIGLGIIGSSILRNIHDSEFSPIGFDIDQKIIDTLNHEGLNTSSSLKEIIDQSSIIITSLPNNKALDETIDLIIQQDNRKVELLIETSTLSLECKIKNQERLNAINVDILDCPISGTGRQAENKDIVMYASGLKESYEMALPVLETFSRESFFLGDFGNATKVKLIANLLVSIHNVASAEAIRLGEKSGLDLNELYKVISSGAATSKIFELRAPMMIAKDYSPASMKMNVWKKDMELIRDMLDNHEIDSPLFKMTEQLYKKAEELDLNELDTASVMEVLRASDQEKSQ